MKRLLGLLGLVLLLSMLVGCGRIVADEAGKREAEAGLNRLVADLPQPDGFETLKVVDTGLTPEFGEKYRVICYTARRYHILGTTLPDSEAIAAYRQKLQDLGWHIEDEHLFGDKLLIRGGNDILAIGSGTPDVDIRDALDYTEARKAHRGLLFVRVDYMVPQRDGC